MNCILFLPEELSGSTVTVKGERAEVLFEQHQLSPETEVRAGIYGGLLGNFLATKWDKSQISGVFRETSAPPKKLPITLLVAVPRPQAIKKICHFAANSGVARVLFFRGEKTSKSYLQSKALERDQIERQILLGLQQAIDTVAPKIEIHSSLAAGIIDFSDRVHPGFYGNVGAPAISSLSSALLDGPFSRTIPAQTWIVIGPELGLSERELNVLQEAGLQEVSLGERVLRVETAVMKSTFLVEDFLIKVEKDILR